MNEYMNDWGGVYQFYAHSMHIGVIVISTATETVRNSNSNSNNIKNNTNNNNKTVENRFAANETIVILMKSL